MPSKGSRLCLSCGICCQGVFFYQDEDPRAYGLGAEAIAAGVRDPLLPLTCRLFQRGRCLVHEHGARQPCCRDSRCQLLKRLLDDQVSVDQGRTIVSRIKGLIASIMAQVPGDATTVPCLHLMEEAYAELGRELAAGDRSRSALFVEIASLKRLLDCYILPFEGVMEADRRT